MDDIIKDIEALTVAPAEEGEFDAWLPGADAIHFLRDNVAANDFVVYAGADRTFIHAVLVPAEQVAVPDVEDLTAWNFGLQSGWGVSVAFGDPPTFSLSAPLNDEATRTRDGAQVLVFCRSFAGRLGDDKNYWEFLQPFVHVFGLHFLPERNAYGCIDGRGDIQDVVGILRVTPEKRGGTVVTVKRSLLADWFDQIRRSAEGNVAVMARMLGALDTIGSLMGSRRCRRAFREHVQWMAEIADRTIESTQDRARTQRRLMHVREALESEPALCAGEEKE